MSFTQSSPKHKKVRCGASPVKMTAAVLKKVAIYCGLNKDNHGWDLKETDKWEKPSTNPGRVFHLKEKREGNEQLGAHNASFETNKEAVDLEFALKRSLILEPESSSEKETVFLTQDAPP